VVKRAYLWEKAVKKAYFPSKKEMERFGTAKIAVRGHPALRHHCSINNVLINKALLV